MAASEQFFILLTCCHHVVALLIHIQMFQEQWLFIRVQRRKLPKKMDVNRIPSSLKLSAEYSNQYVQVAKVVDDTCNLPKHQLKCAGNLRRLRLSAKETPSEGSVYCLRLQSVFKIQRL